MLNKGEKVIFHIDMNSYFASCEQQENPALRGKPVGVCEHLGGIIIAPSIEAKKLGIKTGTPVWEAKKVCPEIVLLPTDPEKYRRITARFLKLFLSYTEQLEKYSIDEAFMDMTDDVKHSAHPWAEAERLALEIKRRMKTEVGEWIRCSVGIAPSKLLAKIASDLKKPDGLTVIKPEDIPGLYGELKLTDIPGIARRTEVSLHGLGIYTLADLRDYPLQNLVVRFGIMGYHLHCMGQLRGSWYENLENVVAAETEKGAEPEMKSIGHAYTIEKATADQGVALQMLYKLCEMVGQRLRANGVEGCDLHLIVSSKHGHSIYKSKKLGYYTQDGREIFIEAAKIFEQELAGQQALRQRFLIKLVGITAAGLRPYSKQQSLFGFQRRSQELTGALDKINGKYGDFTVARVPVWQARDTIRDSIGFGRMKEFSVKFKAAKEK